MDPEAGLGFLRSKRPAEAGSGGGGGDTAAWLPGKLADCQLQLQTSCKMHCYAESRLQSTRQTGRGFTLTWLHT